MNYYLITITTSDIYFEGDKKAQVLRMKNEPTSLTHFFRLFLEFEL